VSRKNWRVDALALQASLHVGERHDYGVDAPLGDISPQLLDRQHPITPASCWLSRGAATPSRAMAHCRAIAWD
jgi:hypothetical protein